ncbi:unnamed protein product [Hapterophycus canaliculatus]
MSLFLRIEKKLVLASVVCWGDWSSHIPFSDACRSRLFLPRLEAVDSVVVGRYFHNTRRFSRSRALRRAVWGGLPVVCVPLMCSHVCEGDIGVSSVTVRCAVVFRTHAPAVHCAEEE